jgi:hypothetical protein
VEFTLSGTLKSDFSSEKKIELTGERTLWAPGPFRNGFDQALGFRQPVHDQTGIGQPGEPDDDGGSAIHGMDDWQ